MRGEPALEIASRRRGRRDASARAAPVDDPGEIVDGTGTHRAGTLARPGRLFIPLRLRRGATRVAGIVGEDVRLETIRHRWRNATAFQRVQVAGWSAFVVIDLVIRLVTYGDPTISAVLTLISVVLFAGAAILLRAFYHQSVFTQDMSTGTALRVIGASFLAAFLVITAIYAIRQAMGWDIPAWRPMQEYFAPLIYYFTVVCGGSFAYFWVRTDWRRRAEQQRAVQAEAEALRAELLQLRLQLDPHFLFNALNGVAEEIPEHPDAALAMLRQLCTYLRHSLDSIGEPITTVAAEAEALAAYLKVQEARFGERLTARLMVAPDVRQRPIVSFLLQPLVENAIKHGTRRHGLQLTVSILGVGEALHVRIENSGVLAERTRPSRLRPGVGLANLRRRLALHYPLRHRFTLREGDRPISPGAAAREGDRVVTAELILEAAPCSGW